MQEKGSVFIPASKTNKLGEAILKIFEAENATKEEALATLWLLTAMLQKQTGLTITKVIPKEENKNVGR